MINEKILIDEIERFTMRISSVKSEEIKLYEKEYKKSILKMIDEQPKVNEWIPVEKSLPKHKEEKTYKMQLTTLENGDVTLGVYREDDKEWLTRMSQGEMYYTNNHKVVAWQPLPKPYEEEENE